MARIVIADDHQPVRGVLRTILSAHDSLEVCGEASDGKEAVQQVLELHPDLIILDYLMPGMNGFEAACEIRLQAPSTKIVVFSMFDTPQMEGAAQLIGVDAFLAKSASTADLLATVRKVLKEEDILGLLSTPSPEPA